MKKIVKPLGKIALVLFSICVIIIIVCAVFQIHIFTFTMHGEYVSRVDCIKDYYVSVYEETVCSHSDGVSMGNCDGITDYIWKHEELLGITAYRRFLCFSKKTEPEYYTLVSEDGSVQLGFMFVLRTSSDTVHYYYRRDSHYNDLPRPEWFGDEEIVFSCDGEEIEMNNRHVFSYDADFTTNEKTLYIQGEPCRFIN